MMRVAFLFIFPLRTTSNSPHYPQTTTGLSLAPEMKYSKYTFTLLVAILCITAASAQDRTRSRGNRQGAGSFSLATRNAARAADSLPPSPDSTRIGIARINAFRLTDKLGDPYIAPMDTDLLNTADHTLMEARSLAGAYTANLGAPFQTRIFSERPEARDFIFADAFDGDILTPTNAYFYDVKVPYTRILYTRAGGSTKREEQFCGVITGNFGRKLNVGADFDYTYSRGQYTSNNNKLLSYRLFGSYRSDRYEAFAHIRNLNFVTNENGGLTDDRYITDPDNFEDGRRGVDSKSFPTRFANTYNRLRSRDFFLTHRYNLGFYRSMTADEADRKRRRDERREKIRRLDAAKEAGKDAGNIDASAADSRSLTPRTLDAPPPEEDDEDPHADEVFVPVASVIHTFELDDYRRRFISKDAGIDTCYTHVYDTTSQHPNDLQTARTLRNTLALSLREGFQRWAQFGLTAYISFENRRFEQAGDTLGGLIQSRERTDEYAAFLGAELSRTQGRALTFRARGEFGLLGNDIGELRIDGHVASRFRLFGREAALRAEGAVRNLRPAFFQCRFHSRYFVWNDDLRNTQRVYIGGAAEWQQTRTRIQAGVENVTNYIYFDTDGRPAQFTGNLQVVTARLRQDFRFRAFGWDNEVVYQVASHDDVLPLPRLALYSNAYVVVRPVRVLTVQLGADVRYFTAYHAPYYEPATQQFRNQRDVSVGNYPLVNAYANFHLRQARFFVMAYNLSRLFAEPRYFSMPHYPLNPMVVKLGVVVTFNN